MNLFTTFAQVYPDFSENTSNGTGSDAEAAAALVFAFLFLAIIFSLFVYVIASLSLMQIFKKAGVKPWIAWVPVYNGWKLLEIGGQQGFWAILAILPFVNIVAAVFQCIAMYHIGKKLQKPGEFVLLAIFLPIVWFIWLAVDNSKWNDKASTAPSLAHE